jgi:hypothetical protein
MGNVRAKAGGGTGKQGDGEINWLPKQRFFAR